MNILNVPENFKKDLNTIISVLKSKGYNEVYIFGSLAEASSCIESDIDIAVRGIKPEDYFDVYGELLMATEHSVDLVDLDLQNAFAHKLEKSGSLIRVS